MTGREMQIAVERQLQLRSELFKDVEKPNSNSILYQLNKSQDDLVNEYKGLGVERTEEIKSRLGKLFKEKSLDVSSLTRTGIYNGLEAVLEADCWYILNEFIIVLVDTVETQVRVDNVEHDYYNINKNNPFKKPESLELCWTLEKEGKRVLVYPEDISKYNYSYIKEPVEITLVNSTELNPSVHEELVARTVANIVNSFGRQAQDK